MSRNTTFVLLFVALGLFAFIWFVERDTISSGEVAEREARLLPRLVRDRVTEIVIERGDDRIELQRVDAASEGEEPTWSLEAPVRGRADSSAVASLLGALEWAEPELRLDDVSDEDRRSFGLDRPQLVARFEVGSESQSLSFGGEDPTGAGYYAALDDGEVAFVVGRDVYEAFAHDASHFRSKQLLGDALPDPAVFSVEGPGGAFSATKDARGYTLTAPVAMRARESRVHAALEALRGLEVARFVAESPEEAEGSGLEAPYLRATIQLEGEAARTLRVGASCEGQPGERHARLDEGPIVCVGEAALAPLLVDPLDLRDLRAVTATDLAIEGIVLERGNERIEVREEEETLEYTIRRGSRETDGTTSEDAFHAWLRAMRTPAATSVVALEDVPSPRHGLDRPRATLRLRYRGEEGGEDVVHIGEVSADGLYVRRGDEPFALVLPADADAVFTVAEHRLADLALIDESPDQLTSIRIESAGRNELLAVREGQWTITEPVEVRADGSRAADLSRRLAALEADRFVADRASPEHGLSAPRFVITARFEGAADDGHGHDHEPAEAEEEASAPRQHVLRIGAEAPGGAYATLDGGPAVFVLPSSILPLVDRPLVDPRALSTSAPRISAVRVVAEGSDVSIRRDGDGFVTPAGPADAERTRSLVDRLSSLLATRVVGYGDPPLEAGLASPRARLVITRTEEGQEPADVVILVGAAHGEGDDRRVFVKREDLPITFELAGGLVDAVLAYRP